jgi:hypothetical protein
VRAPSSRWSCVMMTSYGKSGPFTGKLARDPGEGAVEAHDRLPREPGCGADGAPSAPLPVARLPHAGSCCPPHMKLRVDRTLTRLACIALLVASGCGDAAGSNGDAGCAAAAASHGANAWPAVATLTVARSGVTYDPTTFGAIPSQTLPPSAWPPPTAQGAGPIWRRSRSTRMTSQDKNQPFAIAR